MGRVQAPCGKHDVARKPQIRELGDEPLVALADSGERRLYSFLTELLGTFRDSAVEETDALGMPGRYREAAQIAVLGALCEDGVAITLPQVTGVAAPAPLAANWAGVSRVNVGYRGE